MFRLTQSCQQPWPNDMSGSRQLTGHALEWGAAYKTLGLCVLWEPLVERFIHQQNLICLRRQLAETNDEAKQRQILRLLAEEELKDDPSLIQHVA